MAVKSYKKGFIFLVVKTVANASAYSNASQYPGAIKACKKFASTQTDNKKPYNITN